MGSQGDNLLLSSPIELSRDEIKDKIRETFGAEADRAILVAECESNLDAGPVGDKNTPHHSIGIFQIRLLEGRPDQAWLEDPINNITYAHEMYLIQSWQPWSCKRVLQS